MLGCSVASVFVLKCAQACVHLGEGVDIQDGIYVQLRAKTKTDTGKTLVRSGLQLWVKKGGFEEGLWRGDLLEPVLKQF